MENQKYQAIVLKSIDFKDNDKLVSLYTLERGKVFANLKGVRKAGAKLKFAGEPFCFGEFLLAGRGGGESAGCVITGCTPQETFFELSLDIYKFFAGNVVLEVLDTVGLFDESNKDLFLEGLGSLKNLAFSDVDIFVVLLRFFLRVFRLSGYRKQPEELPPSVESTLRLIWEQPEHALGNLKISQSLLQESLYILSNHFAAQFGKKLRSVEMFKKS